MNCGSTKLRTSPETVAFRVSDSQPCAGTRKHRDSRVGTILIIGEAELFMDWGRARPAISEVCEPKTGRIQTCIVISWRKVCAQLSPEKSLLPCPARVKLPLSD